jgi:phosphoglycolate phosphatase-like HAD superfamily hydrolase
MADAKDCAVIFDVDGVLLELTRPEEEIFFTALSRYLPTESLSRDWNRYGIRNDDDIISEILERNVMSNKIKPEIIAHYIALLDRAVTSGAIVTQEIPGVVTRLKDVQPFASIGFASANLREAARLRLQAVGLWGHVSSHAFGADGGGHKHEILARALATSNVPKSRVVYVGDNVNDLVAGRENGVHFIGFSADAQRRQQLSGAGARFLAQNHVETLDFVRHFLAC